MCTAGGGLALKQQLDGWCANLHSPTRTLTNPSPAHPTSCAQLKACFVIEFDQDAYLAAAAGRAAVEDFFYSRMVLSEGSRVRCRDPEAGNIEVGGRGFLCTWSWGMELKRGSGRGQRKIVQDVEQAADKWRARTHGRVGRIWLRKETSTSFTHIQMVCGGAGTGAR